MLGKSHLMLGAAGWLVASPVLVGVADFSTSEIAAGTVVASGAAMLPDFDHPQATVSRSLGIVTQKAANIFSRLMGGHRKGSHSLLFAGGMFLFLNQLLVSNAELLPVAFFITFFLSSLFIRVLTEADGVVGAILSAIIACTLLSVTAGADYSWIVYATVLGILLHNLGDIITVQGVPLLYPFSRKSISIPLIGKTNSWREHAISAVCGLAAAYMMWSFVFQPLWQEEKMIDRQPESKVLSKQALKQNPRND